jgi:hypothetical protein
MGFPLTGVVILSFCPSSTATSPMGRAKEGAERSTPSLVLDLMATVAFDLGVNVIILIFVMLTIFGENMGGFLKESFYM